MQTKNELQQLDAPEIIYQKMYLHLLEGVK